ncbi:MAG TPA: hypothetical protein VFS12_14240 [Terriglobia bacterium]|nr:hypothetical protein [Terriglobia bacterium]
MHTRLVLGVLIDPLLGPEFVDQVGIAMTPGTELWHFSAFDFSEKPALGTHGGFGIIQTRVSAVTVRTAKTSMLVHICAKGLSWGQEAAFERRVTFDTRVLGLEAKRRKKHKQEEADPMVSKTSHR